MTSLVLTHYVEDKESKDLSNVLLLQSIFTPRGCYISDHRTHEQSYGKDYPSLKVHLG